MRYYPVCLNLRHRKCLVVGGGRVGTRKASTLLDCGARVTVVSPAFRDRLRQLATGQNGPCLIQRDYQSTDLEGHFLVIAATGDAALNLRICREARRIGLLGNIVDRPHESDFIVPSTIQRGDLILAISTSGKSPALAKRIRHRLEAEFGSEYGEFLELMGSIRKALLSQTHDPDKHKQVFERLIDAGLLDLIRDRRIDDIDEVLRHVLGDRFNYAGLMTTPD